MESSENEGKKACTRKLPKKRPKRKVLRHVKKHCKKDVSAVAVPSGLEGDTCSNREESNNCTSSNLGELCAENPMDASPPIDIVQSCSGHGDSLQQLDEQQPCEEISMDALPSSSPRHIYHSPLRHDTVDPHSENPASSPLFEGNLSAVENEGVVGKIAVPREFFPMDEEGDVVVIQSHADALKCLPMESSPSNTPPKGTNALFHRSIIEKVAFPTVGMPIYTSGDHMVFYLLR